MRLPRAVRYDPDSGETLYVDAWGRAFWSEDENLADTAFCALADEHEPENSDARAD